MRIRTGIKPGEWRDEGPGAALGMGTMGGSLVVAASGPQPTIFSITTPQRRAQMAAYRARKMAERRCGIAMKRAQEPCARLRDHRGDHQTAFQLENTARRKRERTANPVAA